MNYKLITIGLVSVSVLMSACSSIRNSPGYRSNVNDEGFQRSSAVREIDGRMLGMSAGTQLPSSHASTSIAPTHYSNPPATERRVQQGNTQQDIELILGQQNYYRQQPEKSSTEGKKRRSSGDGIALNFERASIREVVKVVLGDLLKLTYTIEPGVEGEVTISSSEPIPQASLIPTLESLLATQGAVLYKDGPSGYRVAARANIKGRGFQPSFGKLKPGYSIQVIPLRYIPAVEMQKILEPLANPDAFVRVDSSRNLLMLAGTSSELANLMSTINTFDVDVLQGMSVGIFRIKNVEANVVAKSMDTLFGEGGSSSMAGMIKIVPLEHMNSLMIISASPDYLKDMQSWINRFDRTSPTAGQQLYVYRVQNGSAENLAEMLNQIFSGKNSSSKKKSPTSSLAPGLEPATVGGTPNAANPNGAVTPEGAIPSGENSTAVAVAVAGKPAVTADGGVVIDASDEARIVADKTNNSLMIMATEATYQQIIEAVKRIDVMPMQVQVEASIMEVSLSDNLQFGLQWYFKNSNLLGQVGQGLVSLGGVAGGAGFSYSLSDPTGALKNIINVLAKQSRVRVLSSPSILVLDNQPAEIRVGNQQPIETKTSSSGATGTDTYTYQYKDTGVSLKVTPQVNSNGLVKMEIQQEVTDLGERDSVNNQPTFMQRSIRSSIVVQSGETIVLGGLIRENKTDSKQGVPILGDMPIVGKLFSTEGETSTRTELLVLITPTAIKDQSALNKTGEEMRERMKRLMDNDHFLQQLKGQR